MCIRDRVSGSTAATVHLTGNHAYCCNVGDSRIYLQRGGALQRISRDHTKYQERLDAGAAGDADDADDSPDRHVLTQYLDVYKRQAFRITRSSTRRSQRAAMTSRCSTRSLPATGCACCLRNNTHRRTARRS